MIIRLTALIQIHKVSWMHGSIISALTIVFFFNFRWIERRLPGSLFPLPRSHPIPPFTGKWFSPLRNSFSSSGSFVTGPHECSWPLNRDYQHEEPKKHWAVNCLLYKTSKNGQDSIINIVQGWTGHRVLGDFSQWVGSTGWKIVLMSGRNIWVTGG